MKEKGFTLIELLAVIVILAIISLIAIPIVLNIIEETRESSFKESVNGIVRAANTKSVTDSKKQITYEYKDSSWKENSLKLDGSLPKYIGISVDREGNKKVAITDGKYCAIKGYKESEITYKKIGNENTDETIKESDCALIQPLCTPVTEESKTTGNIPSGTYALGDEYICEVKENVNYHFFVLSADEYNVNLIMDRNICSDGTIATKSNPCLIAWISKVDYNDDTAYETYGKTNKGPITLMNYLYNATKDWNNVPNINMNYTDEGNNYGSIITNSTTTTLTAKDGTVTATYENLKATLPTKVDLSNAGCNATPGSCPLILINNLSDITSTYSGGTNITGLGGYWSISSNASYSNRSFDIWYSGNLDFTRVSLNYYNGIRAVISISKSNFS